MNDRESLLKAFLRKSEWGNANRTPLAGDASNRRYERLARANGEICVLMDAPPERGEDVRPFVQIAQYLSANGMSAPRVFAADETCGFLLLEDLGDDLFAQVLERDGSLESQLYGAAIDALVELHEKSPPTDLPTYTAKLMTEKAAMAWRWYLRGTDQPHEDQAIDFEQKFEPIMAELASKSDVLIQRDYHAENLIWLPNRMGIAKVGMLDFQDALVGHRAYDLVSLMQDARRDVPKELERQMIDRYQSKTGLEKSSFLSDYHLLGLQRNLRILGVFARLSLHFGKAHYVDLIPRVWGYIERDLEHPAAEEIRATVLSDLPAPTPDHLQRLRDLCGTVPTP